MDAGMRAGQQAQMAAAAGLHRQAVVHREQRIAMRLHPARTGTRKTLALGFGVILRHHQPDKYGALAALPRSSIAATKQALRRGHEEAVVRTLGEEAEVFHALRRAPEAQAAFAAFLHR